MDPPVADTSWKKTTAGCNLVVSQRCDSKAKGLSWQRKVSIENSAQRWEQVSAPEHVDVGAASSKIASRVSDSTQVTPSWLPSAKHVKLQRITKLTTSERFFFFNPPMQKFFSSVCKKEKCSH